MKELISFPFQIYNALNDAEMLENSIIIFTTDNGGPANGFGGNFASNFPLRGMKRTLWEGESIYQSLIF